MTKNIHVHPCKSYADLIFPLKVKKNFYVIATSKAKILSVAMSMYLSNKGVLIPFEICTFSNLTSS